MAWYLAAWLVIGWVVPDGVRTWTPPLRWPGIATPTQAAVVICKYPWRSEWGAAADDSVVREIEEALQIAEGSGDDNAVAKSGSRWVSRWRIATPRRSVSADWSC